MAGNISKENGKKGGRPKGVKNPATLEREEVRKKVDQLILSRAEAIIRATFIPTMGMNFCYRVDEIKNKKGAVIGTKNRLVTDPHEIEMALNIIEAGDNGGEENNYYFVTSERPDFRAGEALLNRALGKAKESIEHTNPDGNLKTIIINKSHK